MGSQLQNILKQQGYYRIKFTISQSNLLMVKAFINGVKGVFIIDTGASNTCVNWDKIEQYQLQTKESETKASGAGATNMDAHLSINNSLKISYWKTNHCQIIVFDLSHVNTALTSYGLKPVDGIIGADILKLGKAIIDYDDCVMYLKKI